MAIVGPDRGDDAIDLPVGQLLDTGAQHGLDPIEGIALAAAVPGGLLLHAAADLIDVFGAQ